MLGSESQALIVFKHTQVILICSQVVHHCYRLAVNKLWPTDGILCFCKQFPGYTAKLIYLLLSVIYCCCFHASRAELSSCQRPYGLQSLKQYLVFFIEKENKKGQFVNCPVQNFARIYSFQKVLLYCEGYSFHPLPCHNLMLVFSSNVIFEKLLTLILAHINSTNTKLLPCVRHLGYKRPFLCGAFIFVGKEVWETQ